MSGKCLELNCNKKKKNHFSITVKGTAYMDILNYNPQVLYHSISSNWLWEKKGLTLV